jgi:uncharacterized protein (TIGR00288 family)
MHPRSTRHATTRAPIVPLHRGPQAISASQYASTAPIQHAPNAALLIDFDNVTMGIRSDLASELRSLLSSEIIKGKVAVQRAYADWRRYPQYIVPLAESSIDMIMAPAYGSSKKNATDIRLSVDAMELVFTRPEIGTYILLSGDSDFASLVTKLKEYGKYVIGVGIRESSSDLLVMNCDEYYSYNALAGLVKSGEEEVRKWDPWELVVEAIGRMQKNGDVMRSDRLKQVMQDIDATFDEKSVGQGYSKFSRFVSDAADRGLLRSTKLDNGQLEVAPADGLSVIGSAESRRETAPVSAEPREERGRRGRRGRGRNGAAHPRDAEEARSTDAGSGTGRALDRAGARPAVGGSDRPSSPPASADGIGSSGERLTRQEAFDLVKRATAALVGSDDAALSSDVRRKARELLGRDSESLGERYFHRVLRDAHDVEVIDLRRRGDDYEVSLPSSAAPVTEQLKKAEAALTASVTATPAPSPAARGMGHRTLPGRGRGVGGAARPAAPPPELLMVGVVDPVTTPAAASTHAPADRASAEPATKRKGRGGGRVAGKVTKAGAAATAGDAEAITGGATKGAAASAKGSRRAASAKRPRSKSAPAAT